VDDSSHWETVHSKAAKQQERQQRQQQEASSAAAAAQQQQQQQQQPPQQLPWQQDSHVGSSVNTALEDEERPAPSGPVVMPLFPAKAEPPRAAPWAGSAPAAAAPRVKSLREIQEEEQARAAAAEAARAQAAAAAAAGDGEAVSAAGAAGPWGTGKVTAAGGFAGSAAAAVPPGWGPPPGPAHGASSLRDVQRAQSGSTSVQDREPRLAAVASDELPAPAKKATLG